MALCQVSLNIQNSRGGAAPGNATFTGQIFLLAHGHCWPQRDYERAPVADFLPHNTRHARACSTTIKSLTLLGGPQVGRIATSPLHSRGSPTKGKEIRIGCLSCLLLVIVACLLVS